jgi:hypothetical protein
MSEYYMKLLVGIFRGNKLLLGYYVLGCVAAVATPMDSVMEVVALTPPRTFSSILDFQYFVICSIAAASCNNDILLCPV